MPADRPADPARDWLIFPGNPRSATERPAGAASVDDGGAGSRNEGGRSRAAPSPLRPLPGSNAILPGERVDLNVIVRPASAEAIGSAGDQERAWRRQGGAAAAVWGEDVPAQLRALSAVEALDLFLGVAEIAALYARDPRLRAFALREIDAGIAIRDAQKDDNGRSEPLGRLLGVQPPGPATAGPEIARRRRDDLLRHVRQAVAEWRDRPASVAATAMSASFGRYRAGAWRADRGRQTAPATEPQATWWRLLRLPIATQMPARSRLVAILGTPD